MFAPLVPSRFSAPQFIAGARIAGAGVAGSRRTYDRDAARSPARAGRPPATRIQISNGCVVALPKFLIFCQVDDDPVAARPSVETLRPGSLPPRVPPVGLRSVQNGASTLFGRAAFGKSAA